MDFPKMEAVNGLTTILKFSLTSTTNRLTFDIEFQADEIRFQGRVLVGHANPCLVMATTTSLLVMV